MSLSAADVDLSKLPPASKKTGLTYTKDIKPLFEASCVRCHGGERPKGDLRLDSLEGVLKGSEHGKVVIPGKDTDSKLLIAVSRLDEDSAMPPTPRPPGQRGQRPGGQGGRGRPGGDGERAGAPPQEQPPTAGRGRPPFGGPGGGPGFGPPPKPLTREQVGLIRAWIAQGAK